MIIAQEGFRDEEFKIPYDKFLEKGYSVTVASNVQGPCRGKGGMTLESDISFSDIHAADFDGLVFVGGPGSYELVRNPALDVLIKDAAAQKKVIGAICYAPIIVARTGVLEGKTATVWNEDGNQKPVFKEEKINYLHLDAVQDENFITANGPQAADKFAKMIIEEFRLRKLRESKAALA